MAVHMFRLASSEPKGDVETAVEQWVTNHNAWTDDPVSHEVSLTNTDTESNSGIDYLQGDFRFTLKDGKTELLNDIQDRLEAVVDWYRIGYHVCEHDEDHSSACSWDDEEEYNPTNIPEGVPDFL